MRSSIVLSNKYKHFTNLRLYTKYIIKSIVSVTILLLLTTLGLQIFFYKRDKRLSSNTIKYINLLEFQYRPYMRHLFRGIINKSPIEQENKTIEPLQFGQYYSNWSPYKPYEFDPSDMDLRQTTHVYYSFIGIDEKTCKVYLMDKFSDTEFTNKKLRKKHRPQGLIMEFNTLRGKVRENKHSPNEIEPDKSNHSNSLEINQKSKNFKFIMSIGGWSHAKSFHKLAQSKEYLNTFVADRKSVV